ncbi:hypothetical protein BDZ89DRAFT_1215856, partial [Hymenopellis radicata]
PLPLHPLFLVLSWTLTYSPALTILSPSRTRSGSSWQPVRPLPKLKLPSSSLTSGLPRTLWRKTAWDAQAAADKVIADEAARLRLERAEKDKLDAAQAIQDELDAIRDKRPKLGAFAVDVAVGDDTEPRIPAYAEEKLKNKKWVGLYYFTIAADQEARRSRLTVNPDGMAWVANDGDASGSSYSLAPNVKPSKNAISDSDLSPDDFTYASDHFLRQIKRFNWEKPHIDVLTNFLLPHQEPSYPRNRRRPSRLPALR